MIDIQKRSYSLNDVIARNKRNPSSPFIQIIYRYAIPIKQEKRHSTGKVGSKIINQAITDRTFRLHQLFMSYTLRCLLDDISNYAFRLFKSIARYLCINKYHAGQQTS